VAKKKSRRRRKQRRSKLPLLVILGAVLGVGGYLWFESREPETVAPAPDSPIEQSTTDPAVASSSPVTTDGSGTVAPPVTVHSDTLGDVEFDQVLDDWTAVDPPSVPERSAEVRAEWVANDRVQQNLPDGIYWGFLHSVIDEEERGVNFDVVQFDGELIRSSDGDQLYPAFLDDLLFASVSVGDDEPGEARNAYVSPSTLWNIADGEAAPEGIEVRAWYLLTIIDGRVIAAEGARPPS